MQSLAHIAVTAVLATLLAGPALAQQTGTRHAEATAPFKESATAPAVLPMIKGEVLKIDDSTGRIQLKHEAITNLGMAAMSMNFKASDPALLKTVQVGEKVNFQADKVNGQLTVMKIEKSK